MCVLFFFSSIRRHTRCALVTGVQTCALPICLLITVRRLRLPGRRMAIVSIGALSLLAVTGVALHDNVRLERTLARFDDLKDVRPEIWADTWYAKLGRASCRERGGQSV